MLVIQYGRTYYLDRTRKQKKNNLILQKVIERQDSYFFNN